MRDDRSLLPELLPVETRDLTERDFALSHVSEAYDPLHRPVRGDLAHIRCAGLIFVPHYAVPMPHRVTAEATPLVQSLIQAGMQVYLQMQAGRGGGPGGPGGGGGL